MHLFLFRSRTRSSGEIGIAQRADCVGTDSDTHTKRERNIQIHRGTERGAGIDARETTKHTNTQTQSDGHKAYIHAHRKIWTLFATSEDRMRSVDMHKHAAHTQHMHIYAHKYPHTGTYSTHIQVQHTYARIKVGDLVCLHGLTSPTGKCLNGSFGNIVSPLTGGRHNGVCLVCARCVYAYVLSVGVRVSG